MNEIEREEFFVPISGYEREYLISNLGRVLSLPKTITVMDGSRCYQKPLRGMFMKTQLHSKGYETVRLCKNGKTKTHYVHKLVAEGFIPKVDGKYQVNHKDGNKLNNHAKNLEWVTNSENSRHAVNMGLWGPSKPCVCVKDGREFSSCAEASEFYGIPSAGISACCVGERKSTHGFIFAHVDTMCGRKLKEDKP